jgi:hypothetical protein
MNEQLERSELETVLASTLFSRAPDLSRILKYVCEQHFLNQADTIKEYSIAVEALGRGTGFSPSEDSSVRVQAARLRKHLKRYYETDGVNHPVRIGISATGYRPEFIYIKPLDVSFPDASGGRGSNGGRVEPSPLIPPEFGAPARESGPGGISVGDAVPSLPEPAPTRPSRRLAWTLGLVALVLSLVAVGGLAGFRKVANPAEMHAASPPAPAALAGVNIRAGFTAPTFLDVAGATWLGDRFFKGGIPYDQSNSPILRTFDQAIYQTGRRGSFSYAIPLPQGVYELHLHFAEVFFAPSVGADAQRTFDVLINGTPALAGFDIAKDAGGTRIADERVFKDISPGTDGFLRLDFSAQRSEAILNGIELRPGVRGKVQPVRFRCSNNSYVDRGGRLWKADRYFSGGRIAELAEYIQEPSFGSFSSYRTGNFNYAIPLPDGDYQVRLMFAEPVFGRDLHRDDGAGSRLFDIYCNGRALTGKLDIFREAGGAYRVITKTFDDVTPDAQGKILLFFVPVRNYPVLLAIEVTEK